MVGQMGGNRAMLGWGTDRAWVGGKQHAGVLVPRPGDGNIPLAHWSRSTARRVLFCFLSGGNIPSRKHWAVTSAPAAALVPSASFRKEEAKGPDHHGDLWGG